MEKYLNPVSQSIITLLLIAVAVFLQGCATGPAPGYTDGATGDIGIDYDYTIAPGDLLRIYVWRNPDLSLTESPAPVRPDGRISAPLVDDIPASGKTPKELSRDIEERLAKYIKDPVVTVSVVGFVGGYSQQVRVIGEAVQPSAIPYRKNMSLLDVMISVGGLTEFAAGNKSTVVRSFNEERKNIRVRLEDLLKGGDLSANIYMAPGDIVIIPGSRYDQ